ncbi:PEP-CTERM sorting domain-containing protein [Pacificimonas sp. WHA3]|uniref:PEP-CTERM sorting domain-containing protein n=1 Tax=Pacificimonas pallii TaxID=2827236 RepID=A0ABS6SEU9_9SPHN|nr:SGNH/GDSL hydrolase family protein [Pacificimonas pallii]MBV7256466.1 PEP-CTERM sorting domain-containing protein [Pacificimonas pallii]
MSIAKLTIAMALAATAIPVSAAVTSYTGQYVFGDSLVDAGNISVVTGGAVPDPARGYFQGRFTNGPDFTDLLNQKVSGSLTTASLLGGDNYAFGGARIVDNSGFAVNSDMIPDLDAQVGTYLAASGGVADGDALYTINMSGNDIFAISRGQTGPFTEDEYIALAAQRVIANIVALDGAGARSILLMGVAGAAIPQAFALEQQILTGLAMQSLEAEIFNFSYFEFFNTLQTDPGQFGLPEQRLDVNCFDVRPVVNGEVDCTGIFSVDGTHFSAPIHRALFDETSILVGLAEQVPAPAALGLLGLGVLAVGMRRRRAA